MSLSALIRSLAAAGASAEVIAIAVEAVEAARGEPKARSGSADRMARKRARDAETSPVTQCDVTCDASDANSDAETLPLPSSPPEPPQLPTPTRENITTRTREAANGTRIGDGWTPKANYSISDYGLSDQEHADELSKFRDYWRAVPGAKGRKTDWDATWRNWMRRASETLARRKPYVRTDNSAKFDRHQANLVRAVAGAEIAVRRRAVEPSGGF